MVTVTEYWYIVINEGPPFIAEDMDQALTTLRDEGLDTEKIAYCWEPDEMKFVMYQELTQRAIRYLEDWGRVQVLKNKFKMG